MAAYLQVAVFTGAGSKDLREEEARMCAYTNIACSYLYYGLRVNAYKNFVSWVISLAFSTTKITFLTV